MMSDLTELNKANYDLNNELEELKESIYQTIDNLKTDYCAAKFVNEVQKLVPVKPKVVCEVTDKQLEEINKYTRSFESMKFIRINDLFKILRVDNE